MTVKEILKKYLVDNGFDGLVGDECGCDLKDLIPDCDMIDDCEAGYKVGCDCHDDHKFHISTIKP
jgi:hypothetical protein